MAKFKSGNLVYKTNTENLSGTKTLATSDPQIQFLDPNGADRSVLLPPEADSNGLSFSVFNTGSANILNIYEDSGVYLKETIVIGRSGTFYCDGTEWIQGSEIGSGFGYGYGYYLTTLNESPNKNDIPVFTGDGRVTSEVTLTDDTVLGKNAGEDFLSAIAFTDLGGNTFFEILDEGGSIGTEFDTLNFEGDGVAAADAGGGQANVTISGGGGGSASSFTDLTDTPGDYPYGYGGYIPVINPTETGLEFTNSPTVFDLTIQNDLINSDGSASLSVQEAKDAFDIAVSGNTIISGGIVTWTGTGLNFNVSAAEYYIQGVRYSSAADTVTLSSADPGSDRIDVIALNTSSVAEVITGTPAADPQKPDTEPETQVEATFVLVQAGATEPTITEEDIYLEDTEWTTSTNDGGVWDFASASDPFAGSVSVEVTSGASGDYGQFDSADFDISTFDIITFQMKSKALWANPKSIRVGFFETGVLNGDWVTIDEGDFGWDSSDTSSYQEISISLSDFSFTDITTDFFRIEIRGGGGSIGFFIDDIKLQSGAISPGTLQNLWLTFQSDSGSTSAGSPSDLLNVVGSGATSTSISGNTLTINSTGGSLTQSDTAVGASSTVDVDTIDKTVVRSVKWFLTVQDNTGGAFASSEILAIQYSGGVEHSEYSVLGDAVDYTAGVVADSSNLKLQVTNNESNTVTASVIRISIDQA